VAREVNFVGRFRRAATAAAALHGLPCTVIDRPERGPAGITAALDEALATDRASASDIAPGPAGPSTDHPSASDTDPDPAGPPTGLPSDPLPSRHDTTTSPDTGLDPGRAGLDGRLGLVVHDTEAVQPVLHALAARGHLPGRDLSVVGLCPDVLAESTTPPVTNVSLEPRDVSRRAMRTLFQLLDRDRTAPVEPVDLIAPRLTRRRTTRPG
jgi:hypothetical protein